MRIWDLSWRSSFFLILFIFLSWFSGHGGAQVVTLDAMEIFTKHEWFKSKPEVYFQCKGENKTVLPDVTEPKVLYTFKGQESWQPLTELRGSKCKRCGFYEKGSLKSDIVLDEWEFCPDDFGPGKRYIHFKETELNATFLCQGCTQVSTSSNSSSWSDKEGRKMKLAVVIVASAVASIVIVVVGVTAVSKYWQRRRRLRDQARFMKLFEDGDELMDEFETVL